jgi:hypothetical protein
MGEYILEGNFFIFGLLKYTNFQILYGSIFLEIIYQPF